jgi:hypothetical protein
VNALLIYNEKHFFSVAAKKSLSFQLCKRLDILSLITDCITKKKIIEKVSTLKIE